MPERVKPGYNALRYVRRGIAYIAAQCLVCDQKCDYMRPLDDYEPRKVEVCSQCAQHVDVQLAPELWP